MCEFFTIFATLPPLIIQILARARNFLQNIGMKMQYDHKSPSYFANRYGGGRRRGAIIGRRTMHKKAAFPNLRLGKYALL